jgi:peptide/nickel transport system substrate-binding protein
MPVFDSFIAKDLNGDIDMAKSAATWEVTPDFKTWTFTPSTSMTFHDGQAVEAEDLKLAVDFYRRPDSTGGIPSYYKEHVVRSEIIDNDHFVLEYDEPRLGAVVNDLSMSQPTLLPNMDQIEEIQQRTGSDFDTALEEAFLSPNATGPFRVTEFIPSDFANYEANVDYWNEGPYFDSIEFKLVQESATQIALVTTGQADLIDLNSTLVETLERANGRFETTPNAVWVFGAFGNLYEPDAPGYNPDIPWADVRVREALNISLDRQQLLDTFYKGRARFLNDPFLGPGVVGYEFARNNDNPVPFDVDRARQLLMDAGQENMTVEMRFDPQAGGRSAELGALTEAVADMWRQNLDITVDISVLGLDDAEIREDRTAYPYIWLITEEATPFGGESRLFKYTPEHIEGWYDQGGEEGERLWKAVVDETDLQKRAMATAEFSDFLRREWALPFFFQKPQFWGISERIDSWRQISGVLWPHNFNLVKPK